MEWNGIVQVCYIQCSIDDDAFDIRDLLFSTDNPYLISKSIQMKLDIPESVLKDHLTPKNYYKPKIEIRKE